MSDIQAQLNRILLGFKSAMTPYEAGHDCGKNGPNTTNCHFGIFSSPERTKEWERGKRDAESSSPAVAKEKP